LNFDHEYQDCEIEMFADPRRIESLQGWTIGMPNHFSLKPRDAKAHIRGRS